MTKYRIVFIGIGIDGNRLSGEVVREMCYPRYYRNITPSSQRRILRMIVRKIGIKQ